MRGEHIARIESAIGGKQRGETAREESRSNEQDGCDCHLRHHHRDPHSSRTRSSGRSLTHAVGREGLNEVPVPELQRRGLFHTEYEHETLRENLGLAPIDEETA